MLLVDTQFDCVDINIVCENISVSFDIRGVILLTKESEFGVPKSFVQAYAQQLSGNEVYQKKTSQFRSKVH